MVSKEICDINEFAKLDLRIGKIVNAGRIEGSRKLIRLAVDVGTDTRQLVAGIGEDYDPENLIGALVPVLVNLKPAKLMGVESRGMILAVEVNGKPVLLHPDKEVPAGSRIC